MTFIFKSHVRRLRGKICHSSSCCCCCERKNTNNSGTQTGTFKKKTKQKQSNMSRLERGESCFFRCCHRWQLKSCLLLSWFGTDGPAMIRSCISGKVKESRTPQTLGPRLSVRSHDRSSSRRTNMNKLSYENCKAKRDHDRHKIGLIYSARTYVLVLAAKTGAERQTRTGQTGT